MAYLWKLAERVVPMLYKFAYAVLAVFTSPLTELSARAKDWIGVVAEPLEWLTGFITDLAGVEVTLMEFMFVVGIPIIVIWALVKFFVDVL